jgi:hypothetical protein
MPSTRGRILVRARTEVRAREIADLLNSKGFQLGVEADDDVVRLPSGHNHTAHTVELMERFARAMSALINHISV